MGGIRPRRYINVTDVEGYNAFSISDCVKTDAKLRLVYLRDVNMNTCGWEVPGGNVGAVVGNGRSAGTSTPGHNRLERLQKRENTMWAGKLRNRLGGQRHILGFASVEIDW
ncbi:hypothetical protein CHU98_g402 [Xylaria longipes]|nr:hypothetical protein CHU98_g402 [Xylaria longipes]